MPDKKQCCHRGCHNSRVTFEDAVVAQIQWKGVIVPEYWFGFYCQKCKELILLDLQKLSITQR